MVEQVLLKNTLEFSSISLFILTLFLPPVIAASEFALSLCNAVLAACSCLSFDQRVKKELGRQTNAVCVGGGLCPALNILANRVYWCTELEQQCMWHNPHATYGKMHVTGALQYHNMISVITFNWFGTEGTVPSLLTSAKLLLP